MMKILLVGCGHMGSALLNAWHDAQLGSFTVLDPAEVTLPEGVVHAKHHSELDSLFDAIILAVKPQLIESICPPLVLFKAKGGLVISIAAGFRTSGLKRIFGSGPIVRLMPNLGAICKKGISALASSDHLSEGHIALSQDLASAAGDYIWVKDDDAIDDFTALAGSGPGYLFQLMNCFSEVATKLGFDETQARTLTKAIFAGTVAISEQDDRSFDDLIRSVASPGGTTEAGLDVMLRDERAEKLIEDTVNAANKRARVLSGS